MENHRFVESSIVNNQNVYGEGNTMRSTFIANSNENHRLSNPHPHRHSTRGAHLFNNVLRELHQHVESANRSRGTFISRLLDSHSSAHSGNEDLTGDSVVINIEGNSAPNRNARHDSVNSTPVNLEGSSNNYESGENAAVNSANNSNERANNLNSVIEIQPSLDILQRYLPFVSIILGKCLYDHCDALFNLAILLATFIHANNVVKREATTQARRSLSTLLLTLLYIMACFAFIAYVYEEEKLHLNLLFVRPFKQPITVWVLLWNLLLTDFILKLITIVFKILLTMLPATLIPFRKRGKIYLFMESISQLYRSLVTIQPWLYYLLESYDGAAKIVGVFLSAAYMVSKGSDLVSRLRLLKKGILKMIQNVNLGSLPNKDEIQTAGNHCPICHDEYDSPVLLQCRHIFCESCVSTWFDREQTCPLCRAKIVDDPSWRDGSTTYFVQLF